MLKELREKPKRLFNVAVIGERQQQQGVMGAVAMTTDMFTVKA